MIKLEKSSRELSRLITEKPELADGYYQMVVARVTRKEEDDKPLCLGVSLNPLTDPENESSNDYGFLKWVGLYPACPNPNNPEIVPMKFQLEQGANFVGAAFPDDVEPPVSFTKRGGKSAALCNGEVILGKDVDAAKSAHSSSCLDKVLELWNDDAAEETVGSKTVVMQVRNYVSKAGKAGQSVTYLSALPEGEAFLARSEWEFYPPISE